MRDRWDDTIAPDAADLLGQCVYGSRLLGSEPTLVLHGGGNTSVKTTVDDVTGSPVDVLYVKGSGSDLASIEPAGFTALRLARLAELLRLERLTDAQMMNELRCARLDASAPDPSVESLLHALLPHVAVQHSHADALIALTNQPDPQALVRRVYGSRVLALPYVMPGFDLARLAAATLPRPLPSDVDGLVLCNHGLFTFGETTEHAYRQHIALIGLAEEFVKGHPPARRRGQPRRKVTFTALGQARLRRSICDVAGTPMIVSRHDEPAVRAFVARADLADVATRGPLTPDHVIRTKRIPLVGEDTAGYATEYEAYFAAHHHRRGMPLQMLDPAPRILLDPSFGLLSVGRRAADADIAAEVYAHTIEVIGAAESVGRYQALPASDIFDVEYWDLEQAKLRRAGAPPPFAGEVALVTGAASGIGRACVAALRARGAAVIGLDRQPGDDDVADRLSLRVDVTDPAGVDAALEQGVARFGGIDLVVACAGIFPPAQPLAQLESQEWRRAMAVNVDSVAYLFSRVHPLLTLAPRGARVVLVASKNVPAPGPGAAAYSASKAALTQLARVAALEWASDGIRVNVVHPDAVFDTGLWTDQVLRDRAARYGLSVAEYTRRNLLSVEVTSSRVAEVVATLCGDAFLATTGAQISVDGGNDRVI